MSEWPVVTLSEVLHHRKGSITIDNETQYSLCRVQLHRRGVLERGKQYGHEIKTKKQQLCKAGDLIVAEMDAKFGGYGFVPESLDGAIVSSHYYLYELDQEKLDCGYMETLIAAQEIQKQIEAKGSTNYSSIRAWEFLEYKIPLPPLEKQKRIASQFHKFEKFSISHGREAAVQSTYLTQLRQAILQEAIEGKLTAEWRASTTLGQRHMARDENNDAAVLLAKIKAEKAALIAKGKIKKEKPLPPIEPGEVPFALPEGWVWCRPSEIKSAEEYSLGIGPFGSDLVVSDYRDKGVPLIFVRNITRNNFDLNLRYVTAQKALKLKAHIVRPGDVLITKMGDPPGDCAIYPENQTEGIITADCIRFRTNKSFISNKYVIYAIGSESIKAQMLDITRGMGQKKISLERFKNVLFPLPPLAEQQAIVERVDKLLAMVDQLEQQVGERKVQAEALMQAVLREAFSQDAGGLP